MADDLVKRLRHGTAGDKERHEAADLIEKLESALREIGDGAVADNADDAYHVLMKIARKTLEDKND